MDLLEIIRFSLERTWTTFSGLWGLLLLSVLVSVALKLYVDQERVAAFLKRNQRNSVLMSTGLAVTTPFCSCGTTAVVLGMMASTVPWAPIVAFMVSSPLTSPQELFYSAGLFGWRFAIVFFAASIALGLSGGALAAFAESRGWLDNQARFGAEISSRAPRAPRTTEPSASPQVVSFAAQAGGVPLILPIVAAKPVESQKTVTFGQFSEETFQTTWKLMAMFFGFSFIGYFLNGLIPQAWIQSAFGAGGVHSVPLASLLGIPFYLNTEASMPLVRAFLDSGMSEGAALAFLITGSGTSIGALGGALTIARWRVIAIVVGTLAVGATLIGYAYNLFLSLAF